MGVQQPVPPASGGGSDGHSDGGSTLPVAISRVYFAKVAWVFGK
ncbi:MAG: hypothetical protein SH848_14420 [Saprospiraceae bacterium]|nr:hypothetical protein [Saprospiraceae bacterium]MDZ4705124.1 hypothetical protein [Saprospiraceae bacterium]